MKELIHQREVDLVHSEGGIYKWARVYAEPKAGGHWQAWIEFIGAAGDPLLRTDRETTQSTLAAAIYWATGLQATYFEGAFQRALHVSRPSSPVSIERSAGLVRLRVESLDPAVPAVLMATRALVPGLRRRIHNGGVLVYERTQVGAAGEPDVHEIVAQFGSDNAAARLANTVWNDLHGLAARLFVDDVEVPIDHVAIKEAMLGLVVRYRRASGRRRDEARESPVQPAEAHPSRDHA